MMFTDLRHSIQDHPFRALIVICSSVFLLTAALYIHFALPSGDEPHYLVISQTLIRYHSLNVMLDYTRGDYRQFYPFHIDPHITFNARGELLPLHAIGGPLLWLVPFVLLGRAGAVLFIACVSVLIVLNIYKLLIVLGISERTALIVSLAYAVASPLYLYAHLTFIEPIGAFICIYVLRILFQQEQRIRHVAICSALLGILPWVHIRFALLEIPLFIALLASIYRRNKLRAPAYYMWYLLPIALLFILLEVYSYTVWGTLNPAANQFNGNSKPFEVMPFMGMLGVLVDQEHGLLPNFPMFLFLLPGILMAARKRTFAAYNLLALALSIPYILAFTSFRHWSGGWCPPARFILVLLPVYAFYVAYVLERINSRLIRLLFALAVCDGFVYNLLAIPTLHNGFNAEIGQNNTLAFIQVAGQHLTAYLPSVYLPGQKGLLVAWVAIYAAATVLILCLRGRTGTSQK